MGYTISGTYLADCCCELLCPCIVTMDHGATYDYCRLTLVFNIHDGEIEGSDVGGLRVAVLVDSPKVMTEGNWRVGVCVDDGASDEQGHGQPPDEQTPDG